jgi:Mycothiol maleylpyruvate isomerase N-terminal domain
MNTATVTWPGPGVVQPAIQRPTAMRLAKTEYQRVIDVVNALQFEDWTRPTDCTAWNVRQLVAHIAGNTKILSSPFELARQLRAAKTRQQPGQASIDALTALQVEERQHLGPRGTTRRVGSRRPARGQGPPPDSRHRTPPTPAGPGSRQRPSGDMVHRLRI